MTADVTTMPAGVPEAIEEDPGKRRRRRKAVILLLLFLGLVLLLGLVIWYLLFRQPINPLPPIPATQIPAYSTSIYGVTRPIGVAVSPDGDRIYVTEGGATGVGVVLDNAGNVIAKMTPPESTGTNHQPVYAAVDPVTSEVYVTDRLAGTVYIYDEDGAYQRELVLPEPRPGWQPMGMTFDAAGTLYVTDFSGPFQKVLVIDRDLRVVRTLGETLNLNFPNGIAVDKAGTVYVTDSNNGRLVTFGSDGKGVVRIGRGAGEGNLGLPRGLTIDASDRIFTVDTTAQGVLVYRTLSSGDEQIEYLGSFGTQGIADGQFNFPSGVSIDSRGRVYVADTFNDRVQIWSY
jgi:DNA-binding beta-propeller fold protein YncE